MSEYHVPFRRIVTGHNENGQAIIVENAPPTRVMRIGGEHGPLFYEVWSTTETPARIDRRSTEPVEEGIKLAPPRHGTRIRVLDIPPERNNFAAMSVEQARAHFAEIGAADASSFGSGASPAHPMMHRTQTIDYGIVLDGEIVLVMDEGEAVARAGDIIIQRGTNHGWANRSDRNCRIAFILIDGRFDPDLV
jgi:hypothetical protein